jgi:RNA polymerase-binding transcription factor DksA
MREGKMVSRSDRLRQRRNSIDTTLRHLENERRQLEQNTQWMGGLAYRNRLNLLDRLTRWYHEEMGQIDQVLGGFSKTNYRLCADCYEPIEAHRLEIEPHARFCAECKEFRTSVRHRKVLKSL